jgi:hypothetical protein
VLYCTGGDGERWGFGAVAVARVLQCKSLTSDSEWGSNRRRWTSPRMQMRTEPYEGRPIYPAKEGQACNCSRVDCSTCATPRRSLERVHGHSHTSTM